MKLDEVKLNTYYTRGDDSILFTLYVLGDGVCCLKYSLYHNIINYEYVLSDDLNNYYETDADFVNLNNDEKLCLNNY